MQASPEVALRPASAPLLALHEVGHDFDVSKPWLDRLLEGAPRRMLRAVDGVSFALARGQTLALVGESGCGKSTVARLIVGLHSPARGRIEFDGVDLGASPGVMETGRLRTRIQMIFQDPYASLNPRWRVRDIVAEPLRVQRPAVPRQVVRERVAVMLSAVGLAPADGDRYPHEFSGGQRQRISIARALSGRPDLLICDEPTSALDVSVQAQILNLMKALQRQIGLAYLFISHNLTVVAHVADRVGVMYLGRLVELAEARQLFAQPRHPYTRMLLDAVPDVSLSGRLRVRVAGEPPDPLDPPAACAFHPRCPHARERCRRERPELLQAGGGSVACHAVAEGRLDGGGAR